jgi:hypothetical protein
MFGTMESELIRLEMEMLARLGVFHPIRAIDVRTTALSPTFDGQWHVKVNNRAAALDRAFADEIRCFCFFGCIHTVNLSIPNAKWRGTCYFSGDMVKDSTFYRTIGAKGGSVSSPAKRKAVKANGKLGGRPKKVSSLPISCRNADCNGNAVDA